MRTSQVAESVWVQATLNACTQASRQDISCHASHFNTTMNGICTRSPTPSLSLRCRSAFCDLHNNSVRQTRAGFKCVEARVVGCWCGCLSGARCRQLYDLHINSMTYSLFFYFRLSVLKSIFMFPELLIFVLFFSWRPLSCRGPWATAQFALPRKSGPAADTFV